ncbi:MAG: hypothetical protein KatS3mg044_0276 [Rhodothermaceae bacterium]|nr:MAG: hypothetical protein D6746_02130 [Bacteroidota bacterium]GIV61410.1 MAG: hypothetical protein KatS3mg044_0276 [Rhodothermaceae bacterium]
MDHITFDPEGGVLLAEVRAGFAQPGAYEFRLWEADASVVVLRRHGDFTGDDVYALPEPVGSNHRRIVQAIVTVAPLPPERRYRATLRIRQDDQVLGEVAVPADPGGGITEEPTVTLNLFARLVRADAADPEVPA